MRSSWVIMNLPHGVSDPSCRAVYRPQETSVPYRPGDEYG
jgi:hypothetical protein